MGQYAGCKVIMVKEDFGDVGQKKLGFKEKRGFAKEEKKYAAVIVSLLHEINMTKVGRQLYASLDRHGKSVEISFPDRSQVSHHRSKCTSSAITRSMGTAIFRKPALNENSQAAKAQFLAAIKKGRVSYQEIADFLSKYMKGGSGKNATELKDLLESDPADIKDTVTRNLKYSGFLEYPFGYYLKLAVEKYLEYGEGDNSRIRFDPWNELSGADSRPADVGLFHELIHAWHNASGRKIFTDDHIENELMTIGIPPFDIRHTQHARTYTENRYRSERGLKPRLSIG